MAYPDEIITGLTGRFGLLEPHQRQLRETLTADGIQAAIDAGFDPANLIIQLEIPDASPYISILSPIAAKQIIANPIELTNFRAAALAHPEALKEWDNIKSAITEIDALPRSQTRQRKALTDPIVPRLLRIARFLTSNSILNAEYDLVSSTIERQMNARIEPIEDAARIYFEHFFKSKNRKITDIIFPPKKGGIQLGLRMMITYMETETVGSAAAAEPEPHRVMYYIKTHQHGSTSQHSSVRPVDPKELFVYKVLEYMGYGPKAHFFFNPLSAGGFFIATQDLAFTKIIGKNKNFTFFDDLKERYNATPEAPEHDDARRALICLDILSRILRLHDTTTNPGNFGQATVEPGRHKWKFLDFRIASDAEFYLNPKIFEGFQEGNGVFNYDYADFLKHTFRNPTYERRKMEMAHQIMAELHEGRVCQSRESKKLSLPEAMDKARKEILAYITENQTVLRIDLEAVLSDFGKYFEAIQQNLAILKEGIYTRYTELSERPSLRKV